MSTTTTNLSLFKYDIATDKNTKFNITKALNENWDRVDEAITKTLSTGTAAGNPIVLTDAASAPPDALTLYGKTTQNGTPAPEAPVELVSVESPTVEALGKNLFVGVDQSGAAHRSVSATGDGFVRILFTSESDTISWVNYHSPISSCLHLRPDTTYKIVLDFRNVAFLSVSQTYGIYADSTDNAGLFGVFGKSLRIENSKISNGAQITIEATTISDFSDADAGLRTIFPVAAGETVDFEFRISIYPAEVEDTTYEPYTVQSAAFPYTLRGIPVDAGGNYTDESGQQWVCDTVELRHDGTGKLVRRVEHLVVGNMKRYKGYADYQTATKFFQLKLVNPGRECIREQTGPVQCSHAPSVSIPVLNTKDEACIAMWQEGTGFNFRVPVEALIAHGYVEEDDTTHNAAANAWAAANTPTVIYALAAPTETDLTASEIAAFLALNTYKPVTTILNGQGADMAVEYVVSSTAQEFADAHYAAKRDLDAVKSEALEYVNNAMTSDAEEWTFVLEDGSTVTKKVVLAP